MKILPSREDVALFSVVFYIYASFTVVDNSCFFWFYKFESSRRVLYTDRAKFNKGNLLESSLPILKSETCHN